MSKAWRAIIKVSLGIVLLLSVTIAVFLFWDRYEEKQLPGKLETLKKSFERKLEKDLPVGSSKASVVQFFQANNIQFTEMGIEEYNHSFFPLQALPDSSRFAVVGLTPSMGGTFVFYCQLHVIVGLDKDERLVGYTDKYICTGP